MAESHISTVLLAGDRAYKLLKAVDLGFVDFTDTGERLRAVEQELLLNRRLAPDVYLGTADVTEQGAVVDRMLVMRRMNDSHRLESLLRDCTASGVAVPAHLRACIDAVVRSVAALHAASAPVYGDDAAMATRDAVAGNWADNFAVIEPHVGEVIDRDDFEEVRELATAYLHGSAELFAHRIDRGWVRDGHGDLRAEDIFCEPDGPRILDCLAFSEDLRIADVLADVCFLAMDLVNLGFPREADRMLRLYEEFTAETHPASLAQHYIAYRAHVRTKVCCLQYAQGDMERAAEARALHSLVLDRLRRGAPRLVVVGGGPGTGKSTLARSLSESEGLAYVGSDIVRKELAGLSLEQSARSPVDEGIYSPAMTEATYAELLSRAESLLGLGEPVLLDASFTSDSHRRSVRELARRRRVGLVELRCELDEQVALERVRSRRGGPSDADEVVTAHLHRAADPWPEATAVDTGSTVGEATERALLALRSGPQAQLERRTDSDGGDP